MHCNLRPSDAAPVVIRFHYDADAKIEVAQSICCRLITILAHCRCHCRFTAGTLRYPVNFTFANVILMYRLQLGCQKNKGQQHFI